MGKSVADRRADGELVFPFGFPVKVWSALDPDHVDAYAACEDSLQQSWRNRESVQLSGFFVVPGGRGGLAAQSSQGVLKALQAFGNAVNSFTTEGAPPAYVVRDSVLTLRSNPVQTIRIFQQTYLRRIKRYRHQRDVVTLFPAPISNLLVAIVPGRIQGVFASNLAVGSFRGKPGQAPSAVVGELNARIQPKLRAMWAEDYDIIHGDRHDRAQRSGVAAAAAKSVGPFPGFGGKREWTIIPDGHMCLEPVFCGTLFHTDVLGVSRWEGAGESARPSELRPREFACGILPLETDTLVVLSYPVPNVFDKDFQLTRCDMQGELAESIVDEIGLIAKDRQAGRLDEEVRDPFAAYEAVVGTTRRVPTVGKVVNPRKGIDSLISDYQGKFMFSNINNERVLPIEAARVATAG